MAAHVSSNAIANRISSMLYRLWNWAPKPAFICWMVYFLLTALGGFLMEHRGLTSGWVRWQLETIIVSFFLGQIALATIIGGLATRHWVTGWFIAVCLTCLHTSAVILVSGTSGRSEHWTLCSIWPVVLLSTSAPLVLLRTLWGWALTRNSPTAVPRWRASLEDLITVGVIIACSMTISQVMLYGGGPNNVAELLMVMAVFAGISLVCVPAAVYASFRLKKTQRLIAWLGMIGLTLVATFVAACVMDTGDWRSAIRNLNEMFVGVLTSCVTVMVGFLTLEASGYGLTHFASSSESTNSTTTEPTNETFAPTNKSQNAADWLNDSDQPSDSTPSKWMDVWPSRLVTALVIAIAAGGSIAIQLNKQRVISFYQNFAERGLSEVRVRDQAVSGLSFAPAFVDTDLNRFRTYRTSLTKLSFAGTKATDNIFKQLEDFPSVIEIDLSGTAITNTGLLQAKIFSTESGRWNDMQRVSVADTAISWPTAVQLTQQRHLVHLDASGLKITDEQLKAIPKVTSLSLARNPISDSGLATLLSSPLLVHLDLTDTKVVGSCFLQRHCPMDLVLDGTPIDDATLTALLRQNTVQRLSIARTAITPAILPLLKGLTCLRLGQGQITEADLAAMGPAGFEKLSLNSPQFTGECLAAGMLQANDLDLSNSGVTDQVLQIATGTRWFQSINLANTSITDKAMPFLRASHIDLRNTKVTAAGLANRIRYGQVIVSYDQFTPVEMAKLTKLGVVVEDEVNRSGNLW